MLLSSNCVSPMSGFGGAILAQTIDAKYAQLGGFTSGFDYMRIGLALWVVALHGFVLSHPEARVALWTSNLRLLAVPVLPMFFALSGFLVTGSLIKTPSILTFLSFRGLRLLPALAVEVALSALVLGPLVTSLPLAAYFGAPSFWTYFCNIIGWIHFNLPGVFTGSSNFSRPGIVNLSLWTIPYELECYLTLVVLWLTGIVKRRSIFLLVTVALIVWGTFHAMRMPVANIVAGAGPVDGRALVVAFLAGCCVRLYSDKVKLSLGLFLAALLLSAITLRFYQSQYLALMPVAYVTVYLGMLTPPRQRIILSGDYSYGIYLFAFPLQQTYFHLFPGSHSYLGQLAFAVPLAIAYANFSWWAIEKPILSQKRKVATFVDAGRARIVRLLGRLGFARWIRA